jgi:hypothetical protein
VNVICFGSVSIVSVPAVCAAELDGSFKFPEPGIVSVFVGWWFVGIVGSCMRTS